MRFLLAVSALTMVSSPAYAMDTFASSRAIPPAETAEFPPVSSRPSVKMMDLVLRDGGDGGQDAGSRAPELRKPERAAPVDADRQQTCIAQAVYYESKGEPVRGQRAVADVIVNRTKKAGFASTPCGVIHQPHQFTNADRWRIPSSADPLWQRAKEIAGSALAGIGSVSQVITHFHAARINPGWSMRRVSSIGGHVFY